ncbi:MAG: isoleucine--tRNA ligase [Saprospiraceae bacterium]|nr:isoleucine--tRNA ligase [Saprospiraceae bacterium]MBK7436892.1 isoleucine--tRNA ligase [Saprospiraceae bacterium]MBK7609057.1 isoleucine--tRNA ligase [Saprospiraceae bacterium]MBK8282903.1 isoleucine--tRNA ligase [Saprospiraceae bacterium]MBK8513065.1 isoleucine--tRNA ligase [Saprospiraceae bacterium]
MPYNEYKSLNLPDIDREVRSFWENNDIFNKSIAERADGQPFVFYEGPPSANGLPGIHHVMARAIKDLFCRYHTMKGERVERKGGWDTHGLPIELSVEKELGITKEDIGKKISIDDYNHACRKTVLRYKDQWDELTRRIGYWVDLEHPYITYENDYIESVWNLLQILYKKGLLYKGYTIQPFSPAAGTGLSSHELNMPGTYKEVSDTSIVALFEVIRDDRSAFLFDTETEDVRIAAWTTTPWTLPSNTALTVGKNIDYVKIKTNNPYTDMPMSIVIASVLAPNWVGGKTKAPILEQSASFKGSGLADIRYHQLFPYGIPTDGDAFKVLIGDFVTTEDGTGVVHTAPSFGADDMRVARANGIGSLTLVDKQGKFTDQVGEFAGRYVKDYTDDPNYQNVDIDIAVKLKQENKALNVQKYVHTYPHCWRTDKPVLYYPLDSWFIKSTAAKDRMVALNKTINWKPESTGTGRFGNWLENLQDWNLSRSRYWGIGLPIWRSADQSEEICIGSIAELQQEIDKANVALDLHQTVPTDLHRPYIDEITLISATGQPMKRELDLIDVWFDSGSMPYAQWHYPFENQEKFKANFPADYIAEGVDQTRGWFFTLHAIATMCFDSVAFKNVVSNGLVLDKNGQKMSKRLGNAVDPFETLDKHGADATRWYMIANANPWENLKFDIEGLEESKRKFFGTLYNTYSFFSLYANVDSFYHQEPSIALHERPEIDQWILSTLHTLIAGVDKAYAEYEPTVAARLIETFVDENLSNWYVRLCRRRFWKPSLNADGTHTVDKIAAYQTLYECLITVSKLMAPLAPFFADWLYRNLNSATGQESHDSVHLAYFPISEKATINTGLEERMDYAQRISSLVLSLRKREKLRVRQPLSRILLPVLDEKFITQIDQVKDLILSEVNVKNLEYITDTSGLISKKIKANFKTLGKRLGKDMKAAADLIATFSQDQIRSLEKTNSLILEIKESNYPITLEDVEISSEDLPGWFVANDGSLTVALDTELNDDLRAEGIAREIVNRVQNLRKSSDLQVTDRIHLYLEHTETILPALNLFSDYIKNEVLADDIKLKPLTGVDKTELVEGLAVGIGLEKVS